MYYEYITLRTHQVGRVFNEGLFDFKQALFFGKDGRLPEKVLEGLVGMYMKVCKNLTEWKAPSNCNLFISERQKFINEMK